ncbi:hypothetical protein K503DRAFT_768128 [Rhizopogon vinicolor AM-OR11-026]|uniref:Uncharacterized protein n=1 Tax=Rhizopogon vinicolor AM-OR11-026 TaxID=1314800 RepID=A0A1B7N7W8_9AGAM|nr:hypothetical protein K503DRAFT_768128 [Rhizopogon vinicolor AM-OR11-026]
MSIAGNGLSVFGYLTCGRLLRTAPDPDMTKYHPVSYIYAYQPVSFPHDEAVLDLVTPLARIMLSSSPYSSALWV